MDDISGTIKSIIGGGRDDGKNRQTDDYGGGKSGGSGNIGSLIGELVGGGGDRGKYSGGGCFFII